jgi:hypothetical protein
MGSVGDAYDNAMCESFFATLECELLARCRFKTQDEARNATFAFIEGFYNRRRRHSSIGYLSPIDYERRHYALGDRSLCTPACHRARCRQGQALRAAARCGRPPGQAQVKPEGRLLTTAARDGRTIVRVGTENGSAGGRTKECHQTGGQDDSPTATLIPSSHLPTKPGQVHDERP